VKHNPEFSPGTVSKILWHFTGGPVWVPEAKKQSKTPKPAGQAFENLCSILKSRELRLGSYQEMVRLVIPRQRVFNREREKYEIKRNVPAEITSAPVCCLSDIPAPHLGYHAYRYGKFAIGFRREAAVRHGFNPVFYSLETTGVVRSIYDGFSQLEGFDPSDINNFTNDIEFAVGDSEDNALESDVDSALYEINSIADGLAETVSSAKETLREFVAFVKTFQESEFATIYCEREWRALKAFAFSHDDIAMVVIPRETERLSYFERFVSDVVPTLELSRFIPIVPWEDLVEH
jgi:hypothetical protein